jgi:7,8-dihydroneopterin aldolase/epimerase/oxygenase
MSKNRIMGYIALENLIFFAHHGYYKEEQVLGNWFGVDIKLYTDIYKSSLNDNLSDTIDYQNVFAIVENEMGKPVQLLETLLYNIVDELKNNFSTIQKLEIKITKINPPLGAINGQSAISESIDFEKKCANCGNKLVCYSDYNCWCKDVVLNDFQKSEIKLKYKDCLCKECLK